MVNVDTVYQRVLAIANKEQRGYITPLEFNLLANQAQLTIFENYFAELDQASMLPGNDKLYSDILNILEDKLVVFHSQYGLFGVDNNYSLPTTHYRTIQILTNYGVEAEKTTFRNAQNALKSPLTAPTKSRPIYYFKGPNIHLLPEAINADDSIDGTLHYYRKPNTVNWGYIVTNEQALYNASASTNFELHASDEIVLVVKILELAGITIQKEDLKTVGQQQA